jgi:hypothetical protein
MPSWYSTTNPSRGVFGEAQLLQARVRKADVEGVGSIFLFGGGNLRGNVREPLAGRRYVFHHQQPVARGGQQGVSPGNNSLNVFEF